MQCCGTSLRKGRKICSMNPVALHAAIPNQGRHARVSCRARRFGQCDWDAARHAQAILRPSLVIELSERMLRGREVLQEVLHEG